MPPNEIIGLTRQGYDNLSRFMADSGNRDLSGRPDMSRFPAQFIEQWLGVVYIPGSGDYTDERYFVKRAKLTASTETQRMSISALDSTDDQSLQITATHLSECIGNSFSTTTSHLLANDTPVFVQVISDGQGNRHYFFATAWPNPTTNDLTPITWTNRVPAMNTTEECEEENVAHTDTTNNFTAPQTVTPSTNNQTVIGGSGAAGVLAVTQNSTQPAATISGTGGVVATISSSGQYSFADHGGVAALDLASDADRAAQRTELGIGSVGTATLTATVGDPGSDSNVPTEKAVRTAINAATGGAAVWGSITGTLSNQTDLINALNAKVPFTGATATLDLGTQSLALTGNIASATAPAGNVFTTNLNGTAPGTAAWKNMGTNGGEVADGGTLATHIAAQGTNAHGLTLANSTTAGLGYAANDTGISVNAGVYSLDINSLTALTTPTDDDNFLIFDTSGTANKNISFADLKTAIGATTAAAADPWANLTLLTSTAGAQLGTSLAAIYTAGSAAVVEVWSIKLTNASSATVNAKLAIFGTNDANLFFPQTAIASGETWELIGKGDPPKVLGNSKAIYGYASATGSINIRMQGIVGTSSSYSLLSSEGATLGTAATAIVSTGSQTVEIHSIDYIGTNATSQAVVTGYYHTTDTANICHHPAIAAGKNARYVKDAPTILGSSQTFMAAADIAGIINAMVWGKRRAT